MTLLKRLLVTLVVLYLGAIVLIYVKQRSFMYFPEHKLPPAEFAQTFDLQTIDVNVHGVGAIASYFKAPPEGGPVVLFFHGNGGSVYHRADLYSNFDAWQLGYLAAEYPGYALNPGTPTQNSIYTSALAHYDWLISQGVNPDQILIYGHSLGAASAVHVASEREAKALILSAPFLSAKAMGWHRMPYFLTGFLLKDAFRSDLKMPHVDEPLIVIHGDGDQVIPHHMGKALTALHTGNRTFITMKGVGHFVGEAPTQKYLRPALFKYVSATVP